MTLLHTGPVPAKAGTKTRPRDASADNLKVVLVMGVIVGHATMAWTGLGTWVFDEPPVREPLLSALLLLALIGGMFGMPLFFLIAGAFTPGSLARKGPVRFLADRVLRLGVPMVFFIVALSPVVEYVDPDNAGWDKGFAAFTVHVWWPPAPGPTWFLGVLLLFSAGYALARTLLPRRTAAASPLRGWHLVLAGVVIALASYALRLVVPLGEERWHLALGQAPAWIVGFVLGLLGAERGWLRPIAPLIARRVRHVAWASMAAFAIVFGAMSVLGADLDDFAGGGTWQSFIAAVLESAVVVTVSLWLLDLFRRRFDHRGRLGRQLSRAAFAAFVLHQVVLVGLVLASRQVRWPPEVEYASVSTLAVLGSFALGALAVRLPGVSRVV
jgi:glucan biosynthesis protein C